MATPGAETILVTVDIVSNNQRLTDLRKELILNKQAIDELTKGFKDGRVSVDMLAQGQQDASVKTKQITGEIALLTKANAQQTVATMAAAGSTEQLRAQYGLSVAALNKLTTEERDNTAAGQKLAATTKAMSDELKRQEAAYGSTSRSVGDYNKGVKDVNVVNQTATVFFEKLGKSAENLPGPLKSVVGGLAETGKGLLTATKAALAFIATPLGAVLAVITAAFFALKEAFTATDEGQETLAAGMAALKGVFSVLETAVISVGKGLILLFTDPKEAAKELLAFMESQVVNRIKALGVLFDALRNGDFKQAANGALQLATGVENVVGKTQALTAELRRAGAATAAISRAKDRLEDQDIAALALNEKQRQAAEKLVLTFRDRNLTEEQRLKNLNEADRLEKAVLARNLANEQERLRIIQAENAERYRTGKIQDDERRAEEEQKARLYQLQGQADTAAQQRENRRSVLQKQEATEATAAIKAAREARIVASTDEVRDRQARLETALLSVAKGSAAELVIKKKLVEASRDLELIGDKVTNDQKKLIRAKSLVEIKQLEDDFNQKAIEAAKKAAEQDAKTIAARATEANREYALAEKALEDYLNTKRAAVERDYALGKIAENEYQKQLNAIEKAGIDAALVNAKDYARESGAIEKKAADTEIKERNRVKSEKTQIKNAETSIQDAAFAAAAQATQGVIDLFGKETAAGQAALVIKKGLAIAEISISIQKQLTSNAEAGAKIGAIAPPATLPLGTAYTIATDALTLAAGVATAAKILGFATGGLVPGQGSGDVVPAMLTPGEVVLTKKTVDMVGLPMLSHLNVLGGGVAFATGGLVPGSPARAVPVADGGLVARQLGGMAGVIDYTALAQAMSAVNLEVGVKVITKATTRYNTPRALSTLG